MLLPQREQKGLGLGLNKPRNIGPGEHSVSNTVSKLLDTVRIVSVSSLHVSRIFTVTTKLHRYIILLTSNLLQTPLHSRLKPSLLVSLFQADFTILVGNCKYYQNVATLTCGSGAVAGSSMGGTDPLTRVSVEAKPALC